MKRRATCQETAGEWKALLALSASTPRYTPRRDDTPNDWSLSDDTMYYDPFDCSDVLFPSTFKLVEETVEENRRKWQQLDSRKVVTDPEKLEETTTGPKRKRAWGGWRFVQDRLRLPHAFDYAGVEPEPEDDGTGDRVLDLSNLHGSEDVENGPPTTSYEKELWKLFKSIPSAKELEQKARQGAQLLSSVAMNEQISETLKKSDVDRHALCRFRAADRHSLPTLASAKEVDGSVALPNVSTLRFECWRQQPRRQLASDPNRAVLEFASNQTLLDLHLALVQLQNDILWEDNVGIKGPASGCFFLEGSFYTHGDIGYAQNLIDWIDGKGLNGQNPVRRGYLGISSLGPLGANPMKNMLLEDLPLRLGYRYYHICHGELETSFFLTDRRLSWKQSRIEYPILHDVWGVAGSGVLSFCDACNSFNTAYITSSRLIESDHTRRLLCEPCRELLNIPKGHLDLFPVFRGEKALSGSFPPKDKQMTS